jgi:hypothetical protein
MFVRDTQPIDGPLYPEDHLVAGKAKGHRTIALDAGKESLVLPPADTKRWSSRRKAAIVVAIRGEVITREQACERYMLSEEELAAWEMAFDRRGIPGLRISSRPSSRAAALRKVAAPSFRS